MKTLMHKKTAGFATILIVVVIGLAVGVASFFVMKNVNARGTREMTATVRVADGTTEDEIFIHSATVTQTVSARRKVFNETHYHLGTAKLSDTTSVNFTDCMLAGVYEPVKCTATNGTAYWITLTEIK